LCLQARAVAYADALRLDRGPFMEIRARPIFQNGHCPAVAGMPLPEVSAGRG
jgi:hypothetical protein